MTLLARLRKYARDLETFPHDAMLLYRRGGLRELWTAISERSVHRLVRAGHMLVIAQEVDAVREVAPPAGVGIRVLADADWPALATLLPRRDLDRFRHLVQLGHTCFVAWRGDRPVGYTWYSERLDPAVTILPLPLPPDAAYLWDMYVAPRERGNGIGSALVRARLRHARAAGLREGWRIISPGNRPSLRTVGRTGGNGRVVGDIWFVKLGPRVFARYRRAPEGAPARLPVDTPRTRP